MKKISAQRGVTLVEVLVALGIFVMIYLTVTNFQLFIFRGNKTAFDSIQSAQDARAILAVMVRELRSVKPGNNGSYPIALTSTSSVTFFSDIDADGLQEQVRYFLATTTLKKGVIKPTGAPLAYLPAQETLSILAYNIKNGTTTSMFEYFDNSYTGTTSPLTQPVTPSNVRLVKINLLIDADPNHSPIPRHYTSQVALRNLKDNL